ncbi:MAG: iron-containing alcohol dehydrogenase [Pseudomonadota bacterium]
MPAWSKQIETLITPALMRSKATKEVIIGHGVLSKVGEVAARISFDRKALVCADEAGFSAAGSEVVEALRGAGFDVRIHVLPCSPLPKASVEEAEPFRAALAAEATLLPVSVGSGVVNDLVKWAAFETDRKYVTVATAASMDGYTSAGAPLAKAGFKVTIPTRAPIAMVADLDVISKAPAEMNAWGYGDLAGKIPAGGDWILADALEVEPIDTVAWPLVQDRLHGWLAGSEGIASGDPDTVARLFVGLTAVGFAMEFHGSSRPASGADHQIAHMWEMEGLVHNGRKVSHGAAVAVGCVAALGLYDWLLAQDIARLDIAKTVAQAPHLEARELALLEAIQEKTIADKALIELHAKHAKPDVHAARLERLRRAWPNLQPRLAAHLIRRKAMIAMLRNAGSPYHPSQIGISVEHLLSTLRAAAFIRRRYTIFDLLHETGLTDRAFAAVINQLGPKEAAE